MKNIIKHLYHLMLMLGFDPVKMIMLIRGSFFYFNDLRKLRHQRKSSTIDFKFGKPYPVLDERFSENQAAKGHYFHQDMLVARRIHKNQPKLHVDIGSRIDGFVAHVASFRKIEVFDIRPLPKNQIPNITFIQADLMASIDDSLIDYYDSVSCLHVLEHFGLGRYGDPIKYDGYLDGLHNINKILKKNGKFYCSVPIGKQRIEFNAHRIFAVQYLLDLFDQYYHLDFFSYIDDQGDLHEDIELEKLHVENNFNCRYGCGIFEMTKR